MTHFFRFCPQIEQVIFISLHLDRDSLGYLKAEGVVELLDYVAQEVHFWFIWTGHLTRTHTGDAGVTAVKIKLLGKLILDLVTVEFRFIQNILGHFILLVREELGKGDQELIQFVQFDVLERDNLGKELVQVCILLTGLLKLIQVFFIQTAFYFVYSGVENAINELDRDLSFVPW